jgi:hypothetical protein
MVKRKLAQQTAKTGKNHEPSVSAFLRKLVPTLAWISRRHKLSQFINSDISGVVRNSDVLLGQNGPLKASLERENFFFTLVFVW